MTSFNTWKLFAVLSVLAPFAVALREGGPVFPRPLAVTDNAAFLSGSSSSDTIPYETAAAAPSSFYRRLIR